jgi:TolB protein
MRGASVCWALLLLPLAACEGLDFGGGGGGGLGGEVDFSSGYAFIRSSDRNVYVADRRDLSAVARLTSHGNNHHPALSRDGLSVVFVHGSGSTTELQTVPTAGGTPSAVLSSSDQRRNLRAPVFSPDGARIFFTFDRGTSSYLGRVAADGSGFQELTSGSLSFASPSFASADSTSVLAMAGSSISSYRYVERVDATTGSATSVADLGADRAVQTRLVVSPGGTKAAFDARVNGGPVRIFVADLGTDVVTQLTDYPSDPNATDAFPAWASDSEVIFSSDIGGAEQVYSIAANTVRGTGTLRVPSAQEPWFR